jgi:retron-type reverse transcriptase
VEVLNAIYEEDFLGFSYGYRPERGQHDALDGLATAITRMKVNWILDADVRSFFDSVSHDWLVRFVEHRVGDPRVIRLIRKWLSRGDGGWGNNANRGGYAARRSPYAIDTKGNFEFEREVRLDRSVSVIDLRRKR